MDAIKKWIAAHPNLWEFILFNLLSNCATVTNFIMMWLCTGVLFTAWKTTPFRFLVFDYTSPESLMLCGFCGNGVGPDGQFLCAEESGF